MIFVQESHIKLLVYPDLWRSGRIWAGCDCRKGEPSGWIAAVPNGEGLPAVTVRHHIQPLSHGFSSPVMLAMWVSENLHFCKTLWPGEGGQLGRKS